MKNKHTTILNTTMKVKEIMDATVKALKKYFPHLELNYTIEKLTDEVLLVEIKCRNPQIVFDWQVSVNSVCVAVYDMVERCVSFMVTMLRIKARVSGDGWGTIHINREREGDRMIIQFRFFDRVPPTYILRYSSPHSSIYHHFEYFNVDELIHQITSILVLMSLNDSLI